VFILTRYSACFISNSIGVMEKVAINSFQFFPIVMLKIHEDIRKLLERLRRQVIQELSKSRDIRIKGELGSLKFMDRTIRTTI